MRKLLVAAACAILAATPVFAGGLSGDTQYSRAFLVANSADVDGGDLVINLGNFSGGLNLQVPFDDTLDANGNVLDPGTKGLDIGINFSTDENVNLTLLTGSYYCGAFKRSDGTPRITPYIGAFGVFVDAPDDPTKGFVDSDKVMFDLGGTAGFRTNVAGATWEFGGSYGVDIIGPFDNAVGEIHGGLVLGG